MLYASPKNANAWTLWQAGAIFATNLSIDRAVGNDGTVYKQVVKNLALKGGFNTIRLFLMLDIFFKKTNGVVTKSHDIETISTLGWTDTTTIRNDATATLNGAGNPSSWKQDATVDSLRLKITAFLEVCSDLGIGVILVPGSYYSLKQAGQFGDENALWKSLAKHDHLVNFWGKTVAQWKGKSALIGYEFINEPDPAYDDVQGRNLFYSEMRAGGTTNTTYNPRNYGRLINRCIAEVRKTDHITPVIVDAIYGGNPNGFDFFRVKNTTVNDTNDTREKYNTEWPGPSWFTKFGLGQDQVDHGRSKLYGLDHTGDFSSTNTANLPVDENGKVVYTFHMYTPQFFTYQGMNGYSYFGIGSLYPNAPGEILRADEGFYADGLFRLQEITYSNGVSALKEVCKRARQFASDFGVPMFVGEFSACSLALSKGRPKGLSDWVKDSGPEESIRFITKLDFVADPVNGGGTVTATMPNGIQLGYENSIIPGSPDGAGQGKVRLNVKIEMQGGANGAYGGTFSNVEFVAYDYDAPPTESRKGHRNWNTRFTYKIPVVPSQASISGAPVAKLVIQIDDAMVTRQKASKDLYHRDVLRMCRDHTFSWAHFGVTNASLNDAITYSLGGAEFVPEGETYRLLKRAAFHSYE